MSDLPTFFRLDGIPQDVATDYLVAYYVDTAVGFSSDEIKRTVQSAYLRELNALFVVPSVVSLAGHFDCSSGCRG